MSQVVHMAIQLSKVKLKYCRVETSSVDMGCGGLLSFSSLHFIS